jgi:hypothetical protein
LHPFYINSMFAFNYLVKISMAVNIINIIIQDDVNGLVRASQEQTLAGSTVDQG